jgi:hypothetical protein
MLNTWRHALFMMINEQTEQTNLQLSGVVRKEEPQHSNAQTPDCQKTGLERKQPKTQGGIVLSCLVEAFAAETLSSASNNSGGE